MWSKVFGYARSPVTSWDLKQRDKSACFKNLGIGKPIYPASNELSDIVLISAGIYGPAAPMTVASWDTPCSHTALVRAYSDFVIRGFNLHQNSQYYQPEPRKKVKVTFMARRASVEWPEKHFCNDTASFFKCSYWDGFGIRTLGRMVMNEDELMIGLKALERETWSNGAIVEVQLADYNLLNLEEQIKHDLDIDIMIGPHVSQNNNILQFQVVSLLSTLINCQ
jgi:hypothetical protein